MALDYFISITAYLEVVRVLEDVTNEPTIVLDGPKLLSSTSISKLTSSTIESFFRACPESGGMCLLDLGLD